MWLLLFLLAMLILCPGLLWVSRKTDDEDVAFWTGIGGVVAAVLFTAVLTYSAAYQLQTGQVAVLRTFGAINPTPVSAPGLTFINPLSTVTTVTVQRHLYELKGADNVAVSADKTPLSVDVGFPVALNGAYAPRLLEHYGIDVFNTLIPPATQTALRTALARFDWAVAVSEEGREKLITALMDDLQSVLVSDLERNGFSTAEAANVFIVARPQLRKILPPKRVLDAIAEQKAAEEDLKRQVTLTQIARQEAERREQEGQGVARMFSGLPKDVTLSEMAEVLYAMAAKQRADALERAVTLEKVDVVVMEGSGSAAMASKFVK